MSFLRIPDFSGGLNPDQHPTLLQDNQAVECKNFRLDRIGSLLSRKGTQSVLGEPLGGNPIVQIGAWRATDNLALSQLLAHRMDGNLWLMTPDGAEVEHTVIPGTSGFGDSIAGKFAQGDGRMTYANGARQPILYDGTDAYPLGWDAPENAPVATPSGSGAMDAVSYVYTYFSTALGHETNPSPASAPATPGAASFSVAFTAPTESVFDKVRLYKQDTFGGTYGLIAEVDYDDPSIADANITPADVTHPFENDPAPNLENVTYFKGAWYGTIGRTLYWSLPGQPFSWPAANTTDLPFEGNDAVMALIAHQETLLVFGRHNILLVGGTPGSVILGTDQTYIQRVDADAGLVAPHGAIEVLGSVVFMDRSGLLTYPGLQPFAPHMSRLFANLQPFQRASSVLAYDPHERALWVATAGTIYVIHVPNQAVTEYTLRTTALLSGGVSGPEAPYLLSPERDNILRYAGVSDYPDSSDIHAVWRSKVFMFNNPETTKFIRRLGAFASDGSDGAVSLVISDGGTTFSVPLASTTGGSTFEWADDAPGTDWPRWDEAFWAAEGLAYYVGSLPAQTLLGHTAQVIVTFSAAQATEIAPPITLQYREANRFLGK